MKKKSITVSLKLKKELENQLREAIFVLDTYYLNNQPSKLKSLFLYITGNKNHVQVHQFMKSLYKMNETLEKIRLEKRINNESNSDDESGDSDNERVPDEKRVFIIFNSVLNKIFKELEEDESDGHEANNKLRARFYRQFKIAWKDKDKPVFARLSSGAIVKFKIINNQLIPYSILEKFENGSFAKTLITPKNKKDLLGEKRITFIADPNLKELYAQDIDDGPAILFNHEDDSFQREGDRTFLDENGNYTRSVRSFRKINHRLGKDTLSKIDESFNLLDKKIKEKFTFDMKLIDENNEVKKEKFDRLIKEQRDIAEGIDSFTIGYRKKAKFFAHGISYYYSILEGVIISYVIFNAISGVNIGAVLFNFITGATLETSAGISLAPLLASPIGIVVCSVIAGFYALSAISLFVRAYQENKPIPTKEIFIKLMIAVLIIGIPLSALLFPSVGIVAGAYLAIITFIAAVECNRRLTRKASENITFNLVGDKANEFGKGLVEYRDQNGFTHRLTRKYKVIFYIGCVAVVAVALLVAMLALEPFLPFLAVFIWWITIPMIITAVISAVVMFAAFYKLTLFPLKSLIFEIQEKGLWRTLLSPFTLRNTAGKSGLEVVVLTVFSILLFLIIFPIALAGSIAVFATGQHILVKDIFVGMMHLPVAIAESIGLVALSIATLGAQLAFSAVTARDSVQEYLLEAVLGVGHLFSKTWAWLVGNSKNEDASDADVKLEDMRGNKVLSKLPELPPYEPENNPIISSITLIGTAFSTGLVAAGTPSDPTSFNLGVVRIADVPGQFYIASVTEAADFGTTAPLASVPQTFINSNEKHRAHQLIRHKEARNIENFRELKEAKNNRFFSKPVQKKVKVKEKGKEKLDNDSVKPFLKRSKVGI